MESQKTDIIYALYYVKEWPPFPSFHITHHRHS